MRGLRTMPTLQHTNIQKEISQTRLNGLLLRSRSRISTNFSIDSYRIFPHISILQPIQHPRRGVVIILAYFGNLRLACHLANHKYRGVNGEHTSKTNQRFCDFMRCLTRISRFLGIGTILQHRIVCVGRLRGSRTGRLASGTKLHRPIVQRKRIALIHDSRKEAVKPESIIHVFLRTAEVVCYTVNRL